MEENYFPKYRFEYPDEKQLIQEKLQTDCSFHKLTTFQTLDDELSFAMNYENHKQMNIIGHTYIRDIIWIETEEIIGIVGLVIQRQSQTAQWHLLLIEPFSTLQLASLILLEYLSIARCLLLKNVIVNLPKDEVNLSLLLEQNGFCALRQSCDTIIYSIDLLNPSEVPLQTDTNDQEILCRGCAKKFTFTKEEQFIYLEKGCRFPFSLIRQGFVFPKRCPKCRLIKKIALQNLRQAHLPNKSCDAKSTEVLRNICYSWRYKGYCRYSSECRYIHEDLSSISALYDFDSPAKYSNQELPPWTTHTQIQDTPSDTTDSALSSVPSSDLISALSDQIHEFRESSSNNNSSTHSMYPEYLPCCGYVVPQPYPQAFAPIYIPYPYPQFPVLINRMGYPENWSHREHPQSSPPRRLEYPSYLDEK